jgi:hypothetical protein
MLAPKVQATTIELRLRRGGMGVNGIERLNCNTEDEVHAPSPFASATEAGTARVRAQSLSC